jgi:hypothetical protein
MLNIIVKHTSVNLTDAHIDLIKQTDRSPSTVIRDALDSYFRDEPSALELIELHEQRYHMPEIAHKKRINLKDLEIYYEQ